MRIFFKIIENKKQGLSLFLQNRDRPFINLKTNELSYVKI